jgi:membrane protein YdbS with pleckstrin-like domain
MTEYALGARLRDPRNLVSPRARTVWRLGAALRAAIPAAIAGSFALGGDRLPVAVWIGYAVIALAYVCAMPAYRYRVHRWESTATAVYTQRGWITRERRIAPMSRVQTVDLEQGIVSRLARLATVTVTTASAAGPLKIEGLDLGVAEGLVEELTRRAEAEVGDAT